MRRTILHNLSTVCRRSNLLSTTCEATSVSNETLAAQFCTLTRGLQADVDTYVRSPLPDSSHGYLSHSCAHLLHRPEQLLSLKVSNFKSRMQVACRSSTALVPCVALSVIDSVSIYACIASFCWPVLSCCSCVQSFSSSAAIWHGADAPTAGITPLMQTPAPSSSTSVFTPQAAAAQPNRTAQAVLRKTKISPKKLNEFAKLIRRMHVEDALVQCQFAPNKAAKLCYKVTS